MSRPEAIRAWRDILRPAPRMELIMTKPKNSESHRRAFLAGLGAAIAAVPAAVAIPLPPSGSLNATPANFASQVAAAAPGTTILLASGNYGNWAGTNKA